MKNKTVSICLALIVLGLGGPSMARSDDHSEGKRHDSATFRRANFSNEFGVHTPDAINARGYAVVRSQGSGHLVKIFVNGLIPGEKYAILNHWFEPIPERGIGSTLGPDFEDDPSCNGHGQFLGEWPIAADKKGRMKVRVWVPQLAPHIWVVNLKKFMEVTGGMTHRPSSPAAFTIGGLMIPYQDLRERETDFQDMDPLIPNGC